MNDTFAEHTLPAEHLKAIGCVAVESAYLESLLETIIWHITDLPENSGKFFTDQLRLKARIELLSDIAKPKIEDASLLVRFSELISRLKKASEKRNQIVHGLWLTLDPKQRQSPDFDWLEIPSDPVAIKRRLRSEHLSFPANKIMEAAHEISELFLEVTAFATVCFGLSSPKKFP